MSNWFKLCFQVFFILILVACSKNATLKELERIQKTGDNDPKVALTMLDSLEMEIRSEPEYVRARFDLLRVRLNDKAGNIATSDIVIKKLIAYFESNGNASDKQEVYYYAGSVYRDLQDTPRAMEYFLKSTDCFARKSCDSVMLCNTYSNLNDLYYKVQNYREAVDMAKKELDISKKMGKDVILPSMHLGTAYLALKETKRAKTAFDTAFYHIIRSKDISTYREFLIYLLCDYSDLGEMERAKACFLRIKQVPLAQLSPFSCMAFAQYYEAVGKKDSAIIYCKRILDSGRDLYNQYDAAKLLYQLYEGEGDTDSACRVAAVYMQLSDSLDFGERQELSATINNEYKYHLDQKKERELKDKEARYRNTLILVSLILFLLGSLAYVLYVRRKNKNSQEIVQLSSELQCVFDDEKLLREDIHKKENELAMLKMTTQKSSDELDRTKLELERVNAELSDYEMALKAKKQQLAEKINQNKTFIKLLHQSELAVNAEDVIYTVRESSTGKRNMKAADWKQLYQAVDELYPSFRDKLLKELGTFTEQQMQVCYLMRIGLSKNQIQNMTGLSRVTVWRWVKKYDWVLMSDDA